MLVDGGWSEWTLGECTVTCGGGTQTNQRLCNSPKQQGTGDYCIGLGMKSINCNQQLCPGNYLYGVIII